MTLALYPLVYLPVAGALRRADPTLEEIARSLGQGRFTTFCRVTLPQIRPALLGGCLLVTLVLLAEFGAFEILRYQTFTTTIFTEFNLGFNTPAACALSGVLVVFSLLVLAGEAFAGGARSRQSQPVRRRPDRRNGSGSGRAYASGHRVLGVLVTLALGVPIATVVYWLLHGHSTAFPGVSVVLGDMAHRVATPPRPLASRHCWRSPLPSCRCDIAGRRSVRSSAARSSSRPCRDW